MCPGKQYCESWKYFQWRCFMPRLSVLIFAPLYKVTTSFISKPYLEIPLQMLCLCPLSRIPLRFQFPDTLELRTQCQSEPARNNQCINSTQRQWDLSNTICPTWTLSFRNVLLLKRNSQHESPKKRQCNRQCMWCWARDSELQENFGLCFFSSMCIMCMWPKLTSDMERKKPWGERDGRVVGKTENMLIKTVTSVNLHFPVTVLIKNVRKYVTV